MIPTLNPNGKRPTHNTTNNYDHHHRIPLDPLINNSASKRPRTSLNYYHHHEQQTTENTKNHSQRPTIKKSLSGLIFPHPNQSNNTPLDLLNPSNQSPTLRTARLQTHNNQTIHHHPTPQNALSTNQNSIPRPTPREKQQQQPTIKDKDELKREMAQWQEKYRVAIKSFVFYLHQLDPSTSVDLKLKIRAWGARVDQFFSKEVTHLITDLPAPANLSAHSPSPRKRNTAYCLPSPTRNNKENGQAAIGLRRNVKRLSAICSPEKEASAESTHCAYPLLRKATELKIKIWKSEKLLNVLYRLGDQRSPVKQQQLVKPSLPSLLLKEAQQGHTNEFDPVALRPDYYYFGPKAMFIMVEDITQEHKPIIVKEYTRPKTREATSWPIMWGGTEGKPAFSRHTAKQSYLHVRNRIRQMFEMRVKDSARQKNNTRERSNSLDCLGPSHRQPDDRSPPAKQQNLRRAVSMNMLQRRQSGRLSRTTTVHQPDQETTEHDPDDDDDDDDENECREIDHINKTAPEHFRGNGRVFLAASGNSVTMTSNVASATSTRSSAVRTAQIGRQLIDKRLAALGKRPTFEINQFNSPGIGSSSLKREIGAGSSKDRLQTLRKELDPTSHINKLKRCQSLDSSMIAKKKAADDAKAKSKRRGLGVRAKLGNGFELIDLRRLAKNEEPKTGYCENCRLKYSDFRKHILTRKHRKFALDESNWADLDETLKKTTRRLKPGVTVPPSVREMILLMHGSDNEEEDEDEEEEEEEDDEEEEEEDVKEDEEEDAEEEEEEEDVEEEEEEEEEDVEEEEEVAGEEVDEEVDVRDDERRDEIQKATRVEEVIDQQDDRVEADELEEGEYDETEEDNGENNEDQEEAEEEEEEGQITQSNCRELPPTNPQLLHYELEEGEWEPEPDQSDIVFL
ncbi:hypothetical protein PGTUg99_019850 [Puccinia graminis f. sp. tritici]|uniref:DBF4-type domain-containing protein n=1 Tax=Puccinia graminis f. sp. tritici TaxID=56615 RepID=A0A5B0NEK3_PUCGR|nr:hypothetical protein PGTUg99_019850 [Puccinia graminis f. sp. tritici]